jgi:uncharacterized protein with HEPN domain
MLSMPSKRNPVVYLHDILGSIELVCDYLGGLSYSSFEYLTDKQDAVIRRIAIISEAVDRLRAANIEPEADIDWAAIHNLGNILRHQYDSVALPEIWKIAKQDLPHLKSVVEQLLSDHFPDAPPR